MTPGSLFNIILKILGIFFIKDILAAIPQLISIFLYFTKSDTTGEAIWTFITTTFVLFVYTLVSYYLIFRSDLIIDKLKLDKGFDQEAGAKIVVGLLLIGNQRQIVNFIEHKRKV